MVERSLFSDYCLFLLCREIGPKGWFGVFVVWLWASDNTVDIIRSSRARPAGSHHFGFLLSTRTVWVVRIIPWLGHEWHVFLPYHRDEATTHYSWTRPTCKTWSRTTPNMTVPKYSIFFLMSTVLEIHTTPWHSVKWMLVTWTSFVTRLWDITPKNRISMEALISFLYSYYWSLQIHIDWSTDGVILSWSAAVTVAFVQKKRK